MDLCRVCLTNVGEFPLFRNCGDGVAAETIMSLFNINVIPNLNSPNTICTICMENIKIASDTKESIINAEILIKNYLEKLETVPEEAGNSEQINEFKIEQFEDSFPNYDDISTKSIQDVDDQCTNLDNNIPSVLSPELYNCEDGKCDYKTKTYKQILFHMRSHPDLNLYECERCGNEYKLKSKYNYHTAVHSTNRRFKCKICDTGFKSIKGLRKHRLTYKTEHILKCPHCEKTFCHTTGLNSHLLIHNEKNICNICDKKFKHTKSLKIHKARYHVKYAKIPCEFCGNTFWKTNLQKHIDTKHLVKPALIKTTKPRNFQCSYCDMTFELSYTLTKHMQSHIKSKDVLLDPKVKELFKYKCDKCDQIFTTSNFLRIHKIGRHSDKKEFVCVHCKKEFAFKRYLERHVRLLHDRTNPKNFVCTICDKVHLNQCGLTAHMLAHNGENPFHCKLCDSKFRYGKSLRTHMDKKHNLKVNVTEYFTFKTVKVN